MTLIGDLFRWIHSKLIQKPTNFSWVYHNKLAGSGTPLTYSQYNWLANQGIRSIVTLREFALPEEWMNSKSENNVINKNDYNFVYVKDYHAPEINILDEIVDYIDNKIEYENKPVVVHCAAGKGRTGTILAAYIMKRENITAKEAITKIRHIRSGSIQSKIQEQRIYEYEDYLESKK